MPKLAETRSFTYPVADQHDVNVSERLRQVEDTNKQLLESNQQLLNSLKLLSDKFATFGPKGKGKGKGKKSKTQVPPIPPSGNEETSPVPSTSRENVRSQSIPSDCWTEDLERNNAIKQS